MNLKNQNRWGFTLVELVLVIAVLGLLSVAAFPSLFNFNLTNAQGSARDAVVGSVQEALTVYAANQVSSGSAVSYPASLDSVDHPDGTATTTTLTLFDSVLANGVTRNWYKIEDNCYLYDVDADGVDDGGQEETYAYSSVNGTFEAVAACP